MLHAIKDLHHYHKRNSNILIVNKQIWIYRQHTNADLYATRVIKHLNTHSKGFNLLFMEHHQSILGNSASPLMMYSSKISLNMAWQRVNTNYYISLKNLIMVSIKLKHHHQKEHMNYTSLFIGQWNMHDD